MFKHYQKVINVHVMYRKLRLFLKRDCVDLDLCEHETVDKTKSTETSSGCETSVYTDSLWETHVQGSSKCPGIFMRGWILLFPVVTSAEIPSPTLVTVSAFRSCTAQSALIALVFFSLSQSR